MTTTESIGRDLLKVPGRVEQTSVIRSVKGGIRSGLETIRPEEVRGREWSPGPGSWDGRRGCPHWQNTKEEESYWSRKTFLDDRDP